MHPRAQKFIVFVELRDFGAPGGSLRITAESLGQQDKQLRLPVTVAEEPLLTSPLSTHLVALNREHGVSRGNDGLLRGGRDLNVYSPPQNRTDRQNGGVAGGFTAGGGGPSRRR